MSEHKISVILTQTDVSYGTHAQDLKTAIDVDPNMTIRELAESELFAKRHHWDSPVVDREPNHDNYLTIRIARKVTPNA